MKKELWEFTNRNGDFIFDEPEKINRLYFPLANEDEFMASITPFLQGDIKTGLNNFLMQPITSEDLYNISSGRNFWIHTEKGVSWAVNGIPAGTHCKDKVTLKAGILWHRLKRRNESIGLQAEITNFVPVDGDNVEIMTVKVTNISSAAVSFTPTSAIPIFGRSADNLRDHRHVTSLLNRITLLRNGIILKPEMSFDERGHKINHHEYFVLGCDENGKPPIGQFPTIDSFIGEGGSLICPRAVTEDQPPVKKLSPCHQGKETIAAFRFPARTLIPDESATYILILGITERRENIGHVFKRFNNKEKVECNLTENIDYWKKKIDAISFCSGEQIKDNWLRWVTLQPILRKIFGCSFLPEFDYGRGGKGWRDLWQDCLTLLLAHPLKSRDILSANFSGIRIDGTNATIITKKPGFFIADRNKISRVWMDHGIWPFFTLLLYIHQTGDFSILFENRTYFYDKQISRAREIDHNWNPAQKYCKHLHTKEGRIYRGTVLEHILVTHLVSFFNVGRHNNIKLEGADWNDGLDMASAQGESVAFSCFYAKNIYELTMLLLELKKLKKKKTVLVAKELLILLDHIRRKPLNYNNHKEKQALLNRYLKAVKYRISGKKVPVRIEALISDLSHKWQWMVEHIRKKEWVRVNKDTAFFNGYYDNRGKRVEGIKNGRVRMTLTGQVFPVMSGIASEAQIKSIFRSAKKLLYDKAIGGFRLNTNFHSNQFDLGRAFSFAFGEKENGAVFSHMCVMFAHALYQRNFVKEGYFVLNSLFKMACNTRTSRIYPCLPEYFNLDGKGMYLYLTGSASWYVMTTLTESFGIKGHFGDLVIMPKLVGEQFRESDTISLSCYFAERRISLIIKNPHKLSYGDYAISQIKFSPREVEYKQTSPGRIKIYRRQLEKIPRSTHLTIEVHLAAA